MAGVHGWGHVWQGECLWWAACVVGGHEKQGWHAWQGGARGKGGMSGRGHAWQERRPLVRILLECILVAIAFIGLMSLHGHYGLQDINGSVHTMIRVVCHEGTNIQTLHKHLCLT